MKNNITYREAEYGKYDNLPKWKYLYDNKNYKYIYSEINDYKQIKIYI